MKKIAAVLLMMLGVSMFAHAADMGTSSSDQTQTTDKSSSDGKASDGSKTDTDDKDAGEGQ